MSQAPLPSQADALLAIGLKNLWYPLCRPDQIADQPVSMRRLGRKLALWRDTQGALHALEDHCPHRSAPLSRGVTMGDRIACPDHGEQVRHDKVQGWQRDTWRFLYKNRLEARHWAVLAQDREMMEDREPDANQREMRYQHDMGLGQRYAQIQEPCREQEGQPPRIRSSPGSARSSEDHLHAGGPQRTQAGERRMGDVFALQQDLAGGDRQVVTPGAMTDLPEPDSPTRQRMPPRSTLRLTLRTAVL